jgi:hypothetical protein
MAVKLPALRSGRSLPPERFLILISLRGWVDPRAIVRLEGLAELKYPMPLSGIESATFWLVLEFNKSLPEYFVNIYWRHVAEGGLNIFVHFTNIILLSISCYSRGMKHTLICRSWGSHSGCYEEFGIQCRVVNVQNKATFGRDMSFSSSELKSKPITKPAANRDLLRAYIVFVSCLAYSLTLMMEARYSSGTSVDFQRPTWRCMLEDQTIHNLI